MTRLLLRFSIPALLALFLAACGARQTPSVIVLTDAPTRTALPTITASPSPGLFTAIHSQVTYVPTRTPWTPAPPLTRTFTPTITPTFVPTLTPATLTVGAEGYRLKAWDFQEAHLAISEADGILQQWDWLAPDEANRRSQFEDYFITIGRETAQRFPSDAAATGLYWKLGYYETDSWNRIYPIEDFRLALETSLNSGEMVSSQWGDWLEQHGYFLSIEATYTTTNLFGNGQTEVVFQVATFDQKSATFILTGSKPGEYHVTAPYNDWFSTYHQWETITVTDLNGNGQPEIHRVTFGGWDLSCYSQLALYEWRGPYSGGQFVDLARHLPMFRSEAGESCGEAWQTREAEMNGAQPIIEVWRQHIGDPTLGCADDFMGTIYRWNGFIYEWTGENAGPNDADVSPACALRWAEWAGGMNDKALDIVASALKNPKPEMNEVREIYLRFRLGTWYALRGETELAEDTLRRVSVHSTNPQVIAASQMAEAYLVTYQSKHDPFDACYAAIEAFELAHPELTEFTNVWYKWPYDVCDIREALQQSARNLRPATAADLLAWFQERGIPVRSIKRTDLNEDGVDDWLNVISLRRHLVDWGLWAFIPSQSGLQAIAVEDYFWANSQNFVLTHTRELVENNSTPVHIVANDGRITVFQIIEHQSVFRAMSYSNTLLEPESQRSLSNYEKLAQAEKALFQSDSVDEALILLEQLMEEGVYQDNVLYLLALAHELYGHEREAVQAYWQLWHDYPDSPYTLMARRKLEVIEP